VNQNNDDDNVDDAADEFDSDRVSDSSSNIKTEFDNYQVDEDEIPSLIFDRGKCQEIDDRSSIVIYSIR
jgi:hypothetical protein